MTDNEIIKALECCSKPYCNDNKCPLHKNTANTKDCITQLSTNALDLINRQRAEIERLQKENNHFADVDKMVSEIKSEAIKEFAQRLIGMCDAPHWCVWMSEIEDLVEEMTEGAKNEQDFR